MVRVFRPIPVEHLKLLVFDLDGTLIDSAQDLCNSVNATLTESGFKPLPDLAIAGFVGNGAPMLMRRSLALASESTERGGRRHLTKPMHSFSITASTNWILLTPTKEYWMP